MIGTEYGRRVDTSVLEEHTASIFRDNRHLLIINYEGTTRHKNPNIAIKHIQKIRVHFETVPRLQAEL
jgi:hypothetical protein